MSTVVFGQEFEAFALGDEVGAISEESQAEFVPEELKSWVGWAQWGQDGAPFIFNDRKKKIKSWNSGLSIEVDQSSGRFVYSVQLFTPTWLTLPGDRDMWPLEVRSNGRKVPVLSGKGELPQVFLEKGEWSVTGAFRWDKMPQVMRLPREVGILDLTRDGKKVELPSWNASGKLWLSRTNDEAAEENYMSVRVYRHLSDGAPVWLDTDIELTVTGKSREEVLGHVLPEGWKIATVSAPIPKAIDDAGLVKTQVRAGKWTINIRAFRTTPPETIKYSAGARPMVAEEFISLQNQPQFRLIELRDVVAVDAAQTTFPEKWKSYPLHLWENSNPIKVEQKLRGMGEKKAPGVSISRQFWLDMDGKKLTYKDRVSGSGLQTWRLDAADGQELGAAKVGGESQLITQNPLNGATGLEVRVRSLDLQAVGRMNNEVEIPATGWLQNADALEGQLFLPPGWRAFAIVGPDDTRGDWISRWTLLDFFLLLIFTVTIWKVIGWKMSVIGCLAFTLCYHELDAPRLLWFAMFLGFLAIAKVLPPSKGKSLIVIGSYVLALILAVIMIPFITTQLQQALYPQLEEHSIVGTRNYKSEDTITSYSPPASSRYDDALNSERLEYSKSERFSKKNFKYDSKAKIQTGPAIPEWSWRSVSFNWSGPVSEVEKVSFILIPRWLQAVLTVLRVTLLVVLFYGLLRLLRGCSSRGDLVRELGKKIGPIAPLMLVATTVILSQPLQAQSFPTDEMLETLRKRLDKSPKGIAQYAEIPEVDLKLTGRRVEMNVKVHTADFTAVPLPGKLPSWSPIKVTGEDGRGLPVVRYEGFLWVQLQPGTHIVKVEGMIPASEWTWSFLLKPKYVTIDAEGWTTTGVKVNGTPEAQVFFNAQNRKKDDEAAYDRKDFSPIFEVDRTLELGLLWESTTTVKRLGKSGKAVTLSLPLLPGERIITPGIEGGNGRVEIRLGVGQETVTWQSELEPTPEIVLVAEKNDKWVEKWSVITSAIWNLSLEGLSPVYSRGETEVIPTWHPWSNGDAEEQVTLRVARPEAIDGETMTIVQAIHKMDLGSRQRSSSLSLTLQTSMGRDFILGLHPEASVSSLKLNGVETSIRKEGDNIIVPLRPGEQFIDIAWKTPQGIKFHSLGDEVTLPVDCSNTSTVIEYSDSKRLLLWASGPLRGPAILMWPLLLIAILAGLALGRVPHSPLKTYQWILFFIGLTQIPVIASALLVLWLFWVSGKKYRFVNKLPNSLYNLYQIALIIGAFPFVIILLFALYQGLLGSPQMRIMGEGSYAGYLEWFQARGKDNKLPQPELINVSIWIFRAIMLFWSVWLAFSLLKWARWAWDNLLEGGFMKGIGRQKTASASQNEPPATDEP